MNYTATVTEYTIAWYSIATMNMSFNYVYIEDRWQ